MTPPRILVVGSANHDLTLYCERLPAPGETVLGGTFATAIGGKGANQATAARRAGAVVTFLGATGDDPDGATIRRHFIAEDIEYLHASVPADTTTGVAMILVDRQGRNSIAVAAGANAALTAEHLARVPFALYSHVLISLEIPMPVVLETARLAKAARCVVVLNPAPATELSDELLGLVDILVPNEHEVAILAPDGTHAAAARRFLALGGRALIVTLGEAGSKIITLEGTTLVPTTRVTAVDTVGAGDCFCGVLTAALAAGLELSSAVSRANRAASLSVQQAGAIPSFPDSDHILGTAAG